jgi:hypothetical protein
MQLDSQHDSKLGVCKLRNALRWLLENHPEQHGYIVLMGHSMGSSIIVKGSATYTDAIMGFVILAGQNFDTEPLLRCHGVQLLVIHGQRDLLVTPHSAGSVALLTHQLVGSILELHLLAQQREDGQSGGEFKEDVLTGKQRSAATSRRHCLWDERHEVKVIIVRWLWRIYRVCEWLDLAATSSTASTSALTSSTSTSTIGASICGWPRICQAPSIPRSDPFSPIFSRPYSLAAHRDPSAPRRGTMAQQVNTAANEFVGHTFANVVEVLAAGRQKRAAGTAAAAAAGASIPPKPAPPAGPA